MKFFRLLSVLCLCLLCGVAFASATEGAPGDVTTETVTTETDDKNIIVNVTVPAAPEPTPTPTPEPVVFEDIPVTFDTYSVSAVDPAPPVEEGDTSLVALIASLFGAYEPRTQTVTEHLSDGSSVTSTQIVPGVAGMDFEWLAGVGLFAVILLSFFKLVGVLLKHG